MAAIIMPGEVWGAWSLRPSVILALALVGLAYGRGVLRLRGEEAEDLVRRRHVAAFYTGVAALAVALVSPLDRVGTTIFSGHMIQHLILISVASPLLVYGRPGTPILRALPEGLRQQVAAAIVRVSRARIVSAVLNPVVVAGLFAVVMWAWHLPSVYEAALVNEALHIAEHSSFIGAAILFWTLVIGRGADRRLGYAPAVLLVLVTSLQSGALGAILTFATTELYPLHRAGAAAWSMTPLEDQQLAGAIMWIPQGMQYLATMAVLLWLSFREVEARARRREAADPDSAALGVEGRP